MAMSCSNAANVAGQSWPQLASTSAQVTKVSVGVTFISVGVTLISVVSCTVAVGFAAQAANMNTSHRENVICDLFFENIDVFDSSC
jgi:hypothetical protein